MKPSLFRLSVLVYFTALSAGLQSSAWATQVSNIVLPASGDVKTTVEFEGAAHTLAFGLDSPIPVVVCSNCSGGGASADLGSFPANTVLTFYLTDETCGQTFLDTSAHAYIDQVSPTTWNIYWSDAGPGCNYFVPPSPSHIGNLWAMTIQLGLDLSVNKPIAAQDGAVIGSDGLLQVAPDKPVHVSVPVAGSGFDSPESRSTTVTLQAGSQPVQSQTVSLADIQSGGVSSVTFDVVFDQSLAGTTQTITATIDPGNALNEANFSNNTASVEVDVVGYKLVAFLDGSATPIPDSGGEKTLVPSIKACGLIPASENGDTDVEIRCVKPGDPSYTAVPGCKFLLDLSQGPDLGGHNHNLGDETRPFVLDPTSPSFPVGQFLSVDTAGNDLTYTPPEVAGDVFFEVTGTDPSGNQISGPSFMFHIKDTSLGTMVSLNGAGAGQGPSGNNPGILVDSSPSHRGEGIFGTTAMQSAVARMVKNYYIEGDRAGFTNLDSLASQGATLVEGGLFDANWNGDINPALPTPWAPPHCGHRNGVTIDLSINQLDPDERDWLRKALNAAGLSPVDESNHWHATIQHR